MLKSRWRRRERKVLAAKKDEMARMRKGRMKELASSSGEVRREDMVARWGWSEASWGAVKIVWWICQGASGEGVHEASELVERERKESRWNERVDGWRSCRLSYKLAFVCRLAGKETRMAECYSTRLLCAHLILISQTLSYIGRATKERKIEDWKETWEKKPKSRSFKGPFRHLPDAKLLIL